MIHLVDERRVSDGRSRRHERRRHCKLTLLDKISFEQRTDAADNSVSITSPACDRQETPNISSLKTVFSTLADNAIHHPISGNRQPRAWDPRVVRFGPLSGFVCMCLAIASVVASLGILAGSDNQPVSRWSVPPSTYLAIFTAIANLSVRYAAIQGVIVAWWSQALKGSNIKQLHWKWHAGTSLRGALSAGRNMGLIGIACIFSIVVVVDGPLLQRSSTSRLSSEIINPVPLDVRMVPLIPHAYTGIWSTSKEVDETQLPVPFFNKTVPLRHGTALNDVWPEAKTTLLVNVIRPWIQSAPLHEVVKGCEKSCKAKLKAPALFPTCLTRRIPFNPWEEIANVNKVFARTSAASIGHYGFITWPILTIQQNEVIEVISAYTNSSECKGTLEFTECSTTMGIGEYDVSIEADKIMMDSISTPRLVAPANTTLANHTLDHKGIPSQLSTLGGISYLLQLRFGSALAFIPVNGTMNEMIAGTYPLPYIGNSTAGACGNFTDPLPDFLDKMNTLMLYVGAYAAQEDRSFLAAGMDETLLNEVNTTTTGFEYNQYFVFHTNYWFFAAAALVEVLCISLIAPTYRGWWRLGRPVSFSPLEIAKAFKSPLFSDCNSNSSGSDIASVAKMSDMRYGVLTDESEDASSGSQLAFGEPDSIGKPLKGMMFSE